MKRIDKLLEFAVVHCASDLHISSGYCPCIRVDGSMRFMSDHPVLTPEENDEILKEIMPERNQREFEQSWDTDFGYAIEGLGRFRVNAFKDAHGTGAVFRTIPTKVPALEDLGLSFSGTLRELCMHTKGLIIVTGPTGSGKSTTLAAMIDLINRARTEHIITIEDPIEFTHNSKSCLMNQREVHRHTRSFSGALRAALREDPDIVMLGEMRDLETTEIALETAETGHLVLATLHTNTATSTIDRIIDKFPSGRQNQIRTLLSNTLTAVIAQTLCKRNDGGRAAAVEVLIATSAVRSMIRDQKTHQLPTAIQVGLFETTHGGTLFLDEISSMPIEIQSKLLRVLQDKKIRKVGGSDHTEVDVRIIAASNEKLETLIEQGKFREDLYYRLSVISIDVPPLRNRPEDIIPLIDHVLRRELGPNAELPLLDHETQNILDHYSWPGNVRELENTIQHALAFVQDGVITKSTLPAKIVDAVEEGIKSGTITNRHEQFKGKSLKAFLHDKEKKFLQSTIENMHGDKEKAAEELGISLATLYRKLPQNSKK